MHLSDTLKVNFEMDLGKQGPEEMPHLDARARDGRSDTLMIQENKGTKTMCSTRRRDRKFLSFDFMLTRCLGSFMGPRMSSQASSALLNWQEPAA